MLFPELINIKAVGRVIACKVFEERVFDIANSTLSAREAFNHENLGALVCVDISHCYVANSTPHSGRYGYKIVN